MKLQIYFSKVFTGNAFRGIPLHPWMFLLIFMSGIGQTTTHHGYESLGLFFIT